MVKFSFPDKRLLTYMQELVIIVGNTESSLAIDFSRWGVMVASLREWREMGNAVQQPETLKVVREQYTCRVQTNNHF